MAYRLKPQRFPGHSRLAADFTGEGGSVAKQGDLWGVMWTTGSNELQMGLLIHYWCNGDSSPRGVRTPVPKTRPIATR